MRRVHYDLYAWAASSATPEHYRVLADRITAALEEFDAVAAKYSKGNGDPPGAGPSPSPGPDPSPAQPGA